MTDRPNGTSDQSYDDHPEEEDQEHAPDEQQRKRSGTPVSTWVAVFGSSTVFHVLLLILLGMIIISQPEDDQEEVSLRIPEETEEKQKKITRRKVEKEVKKETEATNPTVKTTEQVSEVQSEMQAETGQSLEFTSETSNNEQTQRKIALGGGGGGGTFGQRGGGGQLKSAGGGSPRTQKSVHAALTWLAKHQHDNGNWAAAGYDAQCPEGNKCELTGGEKEANVGVTGLALLAFLGAGYTHQSDQKLDGVHVGDVIRKSLHWLKRRQNGSGAFDPTERHAQMYNHAIATMAYAEAYGMTGAPRLKGIAQKGVDFLEYAQNEKEGKRLGWKYQPNHGGSDTSVTGWCAMALKSADIAGLQTSKEAMKGALRWVEQCTNKRGLTGYKRKPKTRDEAGRSMTPVGMLIRMLANNPLSREQAKKLKQGADYVVSLLPGNGGGNRHFYYWYYGSLALYMFAGPDTPFEQLGYWPKWNRPMKKAILSLQQTAREGHEIGSWDGKTIGGRVYSTAMSALTLEVYYRYDNALFQ